MMRAMVAERAHTPVKRKCAITLLRQIARVIGQWTVMLKREHCTFVCTSSTLNAHI